jgi:tetratricopeptide (TPR) repeat protein
MTCDSHKTSAANSPSPAPSLRTTALTLGVALGLALSMPLVCASPAQAAGSETPSPPPSSDSKATSTKQKKTKPQPQANLDSEEFLAGYRAAYATIYERNDYRAAIAGLKALGADDRADVANLIGYSYRKLGDYQLAQQWYERALRADPTHVKTWQYYGLWQVEQGHADQARVHLARIEQLCGTTCPEYRSLAAAIDGKAPAGHFAY